MLAVPDLHVPHVVDPSVVLKAPPGQVWHVEDPDAVENVPAGHLTHVALEMEPTRSE